MLGWRCGGPPEDEVLACNRAHPWRVCGWGVACLKWAPLLAGTTNCGCHFLEQEGTINDHPARPAPSKVVCVLCPCWRAVCARPGPRGAEEEPEGRKQRGAHSRGAIATQTDELAGSGRGTGIGSLCRHRSERGEDLLWLPTARLRDCVRYQPAELLLDMGCRWL